MNAYVTGNAHGEETYDAWFARRAQSGLDRLNFGVEKIYTEAEWSQRRSLFSKKIEALKIEHQALVA